MDFDEQVQFFYFTVIKRNMCVSINNDYKEMWNTCIAKGINQQHRQSYCTSKSQIILIMELHCA